jgi:hypothetical protein
MINGTYPVISDAPPLYGASEERGWRKFSNGQVDNKGPARSEPPIRSAKTTVRQQKGVKSKEFVSSSDDCVLSDPQTQPLSDKKDDSSLTETSESGSDSKAVNSPPTRSRKCKNTDATSGSIKKKVAFSSVVSGSDDESSIIFVGRGETKGVDKANMKSQGSVKVDVKGKGSAKVDVKGKGRAKQPSLSPPATIQGEFTILNTNVL